MLQFLSHFSPIAVRQVALHSVIYLSPQLTFNIFLPLLPRQAKLFVIFPIGFPIDQAESIGKPAGKIIGHSCCFFSRPQHSLDLWAVFPTPPMLLVWDFLCFWLTDLHRPGVITKLYAHMMLRFTLTLLNKSIPGPTCHCNLRTTWYSVFLSSHFPSGWHFPFCQSQHFQLKIFGILINYSKSWEFPSKVQFLSSKE